MVIDSFTQDAIKIRGPASINYHRTKRGIWKDGVWIGAEDPVRIRRDLSKVIIDIDLKNEKIDISSANDEKVKIEDLDITSFKIG